MMINALRATLQVGIITCVVVLCQACLGSPWPTSSPAITPLASDEFACWSGSSISGTQVDSSSFVGVDGTGDAALWLWDGKNDPYIIADNTEFSDSNPISPDGRYVWFMTWDYLQKHGSLNLFDLVSHTTSTIPGLDAPTPVTPVGWSANGECLIMWSGSTAKAFSLATNLVQTKEFPGVRFSGVAVSPDGRWWAWGCETGICLMDSHGTITDFPALHVTGQYQNWGLPRWSPDSSKLAFALSPSDRLFLTDFRVVSIDSADHSFIGSPYYLSGGITNLHWSPDGNMLLIDHGGGGVLHLYNVTTPKITNFSREGDFSDPIWSPSGDYIGFRDGDTMYILNINDGTIRALFPGRPVSGFYWLPIN